MSNIDKVIEVAKSQIGITESPRNSNRQKYGKWYGMDGQPWCAMYTSWVFHMAGFPLPIMQDKAPSGAAYCPFIERYARNNGQWFSTPKRGDLALFHFGKREAVHIGIVETVQSGGRFFSIEGNTSASSNDNGGAVMRRARNSNQCRGFYRPTITETTATPTGYYRIIRLSSPLMRGEDIKAWQKQANYFSYGLDVDGVYGKLSEQACKKFQTTRRLTVDGIIGEITWAETFKKLS